MVSGAAGVRGEFCGKWVAPPLDGVVNGYVPSQTAYFALPGFKGKDSD